jgi:hypothetical protein
MYSQPFDEQQSPHIPQSKSHLYKKMHDGPYLNVTVNSSRGDTSEYIAS